MIYKSYIVEQNINTVIDNKIFLFHGENHGLIKEFKDKLSDKFKDIKILNLFQDELIKNKNLLENEILNKSLFDEKKIIFINECNDKILEILKDLIENIDSDKIFLFSDNLDKKSKLRNYLEKSKNCGISACYKDNEITIKKIISEKLKGYQGLTPTIVNLITSNSNLDRNKVSNEIQKVKSYFADKVINASKLEILLNIKNNEDFNELKDQALIGNKLKTNRLLADTTLSDENTVFYLNIINQRMNKLNEIENLKQKNNNIEVLLNTLRPPVFWKDKPILIEQSKKWNEKKIQKALKKTFETEIIIKSNATIRKDLLIKNLIVDLCNTANIF
jgi:DNA polymerase III subunit delta